MMTTRLLALAVLLAAIGTARSESWTNQAGRAVEGRLANFDGMWLTLVRTNGASVRLPLSALCKTDQNRVLAQSSFSIAPEFAIAAYRDAAGVLERFERLPPEQQTPEGRKAAIQMACAVFDGRIGPRQAELKDAAVRKEVMRLRTQLASGNR